MRRQLQFIFLIIVSLTLFSTAYGRLPHWRNPHFEEVLDYVHDYLKIFSEVDKEELNNKLKPLLKREKKQKKEWLKTEGLKVSDYEFSNFENKILRYLMYTEVLNNPEPYEDYIDRHGERPPGLNQHPLKFYEKNWNVIKQQYKNDRAKLRLDAEILRYPKSTE